MCTLRRDREETDKTRENSGGRREGHTCGCLALCLFSVRSVARTKSDWVSVSAHDTTLHHLRSFPFSFPAPCVSCLFYSSVGIKNFFPLCVCQCYSALPCWCLPRIRFHLFGREAAFFFFSLLFALGSVHKYNETATTHHYKESGIEDGERRGAASSSSSSRPKKKRDSDSKLRKREESQIERKIKIKEAESLFGAYILYLDFFLYEVLTYLRTHYVHTSLLLQRVGSVSLVFCERIFMEYKYII